MTSTFPFTPAIWSYGVAAMTFFAFAARMLMGWRGGIRASLLFSAVVASGVWAGSVWAALVFVSADWWRIACIADALRIGAWLIFATLLLEGWGQSTSRGDRIRRFARFFVVPLLLVVAGVFLFAEPPWRRAPAEEGAPIAYYIWLGASVLGLVLTEQLYQRSSASRRWAIKPLVIGLAGMFILDLFIFSEAILFHRVDPALWSSRGIASVIVIFFVGVATARNTSWTVDLYVSRGVVYQSTAMMMAGFYLLIVAAAAYWVEIFGGDWGGVLQVAVVFASLLGLAALVLSGSLRARVKVLISKNLFSFRYEYRQEWLRFTHTLGTTEDDEGLYHRAIRAICNLVESTGGAIWLERDGTFAEVASLNLSSIKAVEPVSGSLVAFLTRKDWVIQVDELRDFPGNYPDLKVPAWLQSFREAWLIVPLPNGPDLIGFVILAKPRASIDINWEVRDLLKTASRQAASYIAQIRAKEALLESKQFDAFNRMSAFVVHDLKNLVSQLALLVKNAERHRDNPEFQQDMVETVDHAVGRMNQLMLQLRTGTQPVEKPRPIDLNAAIQRIIRGQMRHEEVIDVETLPSPKILAHEDRIERAIGHFVQNALEAVQRRDGGVRIRIYAEGSFAVVAIADDGVGMTNEFVRERLFHPFQTTKPQGMGIGMYESYQYINGIGGRITVDTAPNSGTRFDIYLPTASNADNSASFSGTSA